MGECNFPSVSTLSNWVYVLRKEDLENKSTGTAVLQSASQHILFNLPKKDAVLKWRFLAAANEDRLKFLKTDYACEPILQYMKVGQELRVPVGWPTQNLTQHQAWPGPESSDSGAEGTGASSGETCVPPTGSPPTHEDRWYVVKPQDVANASNAKEVLQNIVETIRYDIPASEARKHWAPLSLANKDRLDYVKQGGLCLPRYKKGNCSNPGERSICVGKRLKVPIGWPVGALLYKPTSIDPTSWLEQQTIPMPNGGGKKITMPGGKVIQIPSGGGQTVTAPQPQGQPEWSGTVAPEDDQPGAAPAGQDEDDLVEAGAQPDVEQGPQTEDGEEESSTLLWILGGATLAGLGLWWMMGSKK